MIRSYLFRHKLSFQIVVCIGAASIRFFRSNFGVVADATFNSPFKFAHKKRIGALDHSTVSFRIELREKHRDAIVNRICGRQIPIPTGVGQ